MSFNNPVSFYGRMFTTDLDGTYLTPDKNNMRKNVQDRTFKMSSIRETEEALQNGGFDRVLINTGRNFSELKEIQDILKSSKMPIEAISLEDGKRLLKKPEGLTSQQWMAQLFNRDINYLKFEDKAWAENNKKPLYIIGRYLIEQKGFIHRKNDGEEIIFSKPINQDTSVNDNSRWEVAIVPPGIKIKVKAKGTDNIGKEDIIKFSTQLTDDIKKILEEQGYCVNSAEEEDFSVVTTFSRSDINKASVADYVKSCTDEPVDEVRAGDGENDAEMLSDSSVIGIQTGENPELTKILKNKSNIITVPLGFLGQGIKEASKRLDLVG